MKVTNEKDKRASEINSGECFSYADDLFIVTDEYHDNLRRCVKFKTGTVFYFGQELVTPVDAEVIIHD